MEFASPLLVLFLLTQVLERFLEVVSPLFGSPDILDKRGAEKKALFMFLIGSFLGFIICFLGKVDLFKLCGLPLSSDILSYILTGIAAGGGSKPLHDIISSLAKYRDKLRKENGSIKPFKPND